MKGGVVVLLAKREFGGGILKYREEDDDSTEGIGIIVAVVVIAIVLLFTDFESVGRNEGRTVAGRRGKATDIVSFQPFFHVGMASNYTAVKIKR